MARILIAYASTEGQTRKVAEYLADTLRIRGHAIDCLDCASPAAVDWPDDPSCAGVILAGSVHQSRYQPALQHFAASHRDWLAGRVTAFVSVSLSALLADAASRAELEKLVQDFCADTGLRPALTLQAAGALRYTQYEWFKRMMMKLLAEQQGQDGDTSRDHEFTDWDQLREFGDRFAERVASQAGR